MSREMFSPTDNQFNVGHQYGDNTHITAGNLVQGTGNINIYQNNEPASPISADEIKKCCDEIKEKLKTSEIMRSQTDRSSNSTHPIGLRMRQSNKFGLQFINDRLDMAKTLCNELVNDIAVEELFIKAKEFAAQAKSLKNEEHQSNFVGLVGGAKVGKTTLVKHLIQHLSQQHQYDYVFYFDLKNVSKKTDLLKFLLPPNLPWMANKSIKSAVLQAIVKQPEKICLIFDDLDVGKLQLEDFSRLDYFQDECLTSSNIVLNILKGDIFSESKKILVSSHFELHNLPGDYKPAFIVNIVGLTREDQENVFRHNEQDLEATIGKFQSLPDIHLLCAVPLNCEAFLELCRDSDSFITYCSMFVTVFYQFLVEMEKTSQNYDLQKLTDFAWSQFVRNKEMEKKVSEIYCFDKEEFENKILGKSQINSFFVTTFCRNPMLNLRKFPIPKFHFSSLLMHDFLVAVKLYALDSIHIDKFLFNASKDILKSPRISRYFIVIIFLCGFCNYDLIVFPNDNFIQKLFTNCQQQKVKTALDKFLTNLARSLNGSNQSSNHEVIDFILICKKELEEKICLTGNGR